MELIIASIVGILFVNFVLPLFDCFLALTSTSVNYVSSKINLKILKLQKDYKLDSEECIAPSAIGFVYSGDGDDDGDDDMED